MHTRRQELQQCIDEVNESLLALNPYTMLQTKTELTNRIKQHFRYQNITPPLVTAREFVTIDPIPDFSKWTTAFGGWGKYGARNGVHNAQKPLPSLNTALGTTFTVSAKQIIRYKFCNSSGLDNYSCGDNNCRYPHTKPFAVVISSSDNAKFCSILTGLENQHRRFYFIPCHYEQPRRPEYISDWDKFLKDLLAGTCYLCLFELNRDLTTDHMFFSFLGLLVSSGNGVTLESMSNGAGTFRIY
jgi:hypothetical protein